MRLVQLDDIKRINGNYSNGCLLRDISSIYSSYLYENTIQEKIANIFSHIIKGHYFIDGNKRTACIVLLVLCRINNLSTKINKNNLVEFALDTASNNYNTSILVEKIF